MRRFILFFASIFIAALGTSPASAQFKGYDDSFADSTFAVLIDIDVTTGAGSIPPEYLGCTGSPVNTVFGVDFTSGLAYIGDTLYGLEWNGGSGPDIFLYTMARTFCATGARVGAVPVGFTNLECLAYCPIDGFLYSADFDFPAHEGRLIRIDPQTGVGTVVGGPMARDVRIGGMTYDLIPGHLYAVTLSFDQKRPELYLIDRQTGVETLVGATGTPDR